MRSTKGRIWSVAFTLACALLGVTSDIATAATIDLGGRHIRNPNGTCLTYKGLSNVTITNGVIGPCGKHGLVLEDSTNVRITRMRITGVDETGIYLDSNNSVAVAENVIHDTRNAILAISSSSIRVTCNTLTNSRGPGPSGQHVQFNRVSGSTNRIMCNRGENGSGTMPEDAISLYQSCTVQSPILVMGNLLIGGGPSESGGGIMVGDMSGSNILVRDNTLVDPGQYGIAVASGTNVALLRNRVYARQRPWSNVGVYVWRQYPSSCRNITLIGNLVNWTNSDGRRNGFWNGGGCDVVTVGANNNFNAAFGPGIVNQMPPVDCVCLLAGRARPGSN
jgi:hypothetical protein